MSKQTRKDKKAEEKRLIAQFEEALQEERGQSAEKGEAFATAPLDTPEKIHCKRCKTLMKEGVCPVCGFKIYQPMSEEKRKKVKTIIAVVALVAFAIFLVAGLIKG